MTCNPHPQFRRASPPVPRGWLVILVAPLVLAAGCQKRMPDEPHPEPSILNEQSAIASNILADAHSYADHARIEALENQVDALELKVDNADAAILDARISALEVANASPPPRDVPLPAAIKPTSPAKSAPVDTSVPSRWIDPKDTR